MGQLGKLQMTFEDEERSIELKLTNIDPIIQFKIMELCHKAVHQAEEKDNKKQEEEKAIEKTKVISKTGQTEEEVKKGYQFFSNRTAESEQQYKPTAPRINTYDPEKSVRVFNGVKRYQLYYICPDCGNKGKHHITPGTPKVHCHEATCSREMMVRLATPKGLPDHDEWGNYYIAGDFKMTMKDKEEEEKFHQEENSRAYAYN